MPRDINRAVFLFAVTRERVTDGSARGPLDAARFYSLLRESGSLTPIFLDSTEWVEEFLFAVTRERVTDFPHLSNH